MSSASHFLSGDRRARVLSLYHGPVEARRLFHAIHDRILTESVAIDTANFQEISTADLKLLFDMYDHSFFGCFLGQWIREDVATLNFRLSNRMTRSGGTTQRLRPRKGVVRRDTFTITVSTVLLFQSFREAGRPINVGGLECKDRLEALQRIFEHELLHLTEFLAWDVSSCFQENFQILSRNLFGHAGVKHELVTPHEVAATEFDIRPGDQVAFEFEGIHHVGVVNRITKRATILVEDLNGRLYSSGKKYATFYVPISMLKKKRS